MRAELEAYSLLKALSHSTGKCCTGCWGRKRLHSAVYSVTVMKGWASIADWCNWGISAEEVTNHSLIRFEASSMGNGGAGCLVL